MANVDLDVSVAVTADGKKVKVVDRADGTEVKETRTFSEKRNDTITLWGTPGVDIEELCILGGRWKGNAYRYGSNSMLGEPAEGARGWKLQINFTEKNKVVLKDINMTAETWVYEFGVRVKHGNDSILWDPEVREEPET